MLSGILPGLKVSIHQTVKHCVLLQVVQQDCLSKEHMVESCGSFAVACDINVVMHQDTCRQPCLWVQATMARKLRDSDIATQWTLNYQLNTKLRMQFNISSSSPYPRTLVFQYSGEGGPRS